MSLAHQIQCGELYWKLDFIPLSIRLFSGMIITDCTLIPSSSNESIKQSDFVK